MLEKGEFLLKITFSDDIKNWIGKYRKLRLRESWDFPEAGVAAAWVQGDKTTMRVATTALESIPRLHEEEVASCEGDITKLANTIFANVKPVNNTSLPPRYRRNMIKVLVKRACED